MIPISRVEMYLAKICGEDVELPIPQTRKEVFLAIIAGESYEKPVPSSRVELYLAKILGDDVPLPIPQSREEIFLAKIAGVEYPLPYPESRIEYWLHKWATYEEWDTITGNPVSFTAKAAPLRKLEVAFSPVQNLNGYDSPWPAGGGKNLFQTTATSKTESGVTWTVNADGTITVSGTATGYTDFEAGMARVDSSMGNITVSGIAGATNIAWASVQVRDVNSNVLYDISNGGTYSELHCDLSQYPDAYYVRVLLKRNNNVATSGTVKIQVEKGTTATAWTPYSNECPISGWSSLTVEQRGVNMWDEEWEVGQINGSNGADSTSTEYWRSKSFIHVKPLTDYYVSCPSVASVAIRTRFYDAQKNYIGYVDGNGATYPTTNMTIKTPANCYFMRFNPSISNIPSGTKLSINYPSTDHDYHAYNPLSRSISINLGSTIYSGTVDVVTGVGEINWVKDVYDGSSDEVWGYAINETHAAFYTQISYPANNPQSMGNYLKRVTAFGAVSGFSYIIHSNQIRVSDMGGECADTTSAGAVAKLRAYLAANPFEVVHKITTPIPISLTPQEVQSLAGDNVVWSTANGDLTVEYRSN